MKAMLIDRMAAPAVSAFPSALLHGNFLATAAGLASLFGGPAAQAQQPVQLLHVAPDVLRLRIDNPQQLASSVRVLRLANGQPLFEETYRAAAYGHQFSFKGVPAGRYALLLRVGPSRYRYTVRVRAQGPQLVATVLRLRTQQAAPLGPATAAL